MDIKQSGKFMISIMHYTMNYSYSQGGGRRRGLGVKMDFKKKRPKMTPGYLRVKRELAECKAQEKAWQQRVWQLQKKVQRLTHQLKQKEQKVFPCSESTDDWSSPGRTLMKSACKLLKEAGLKPSEHPIR